MNTVRKLAEESGSNVEVWAGINKSARMASRHEEMLKGMKNVHLTPSEGGASVETITKQLQEVDNLFIIPSPTEDKVENARNYIEAAKRANVKFVLLLSVLHPDARNFSWGQEFRTIERHLQESGLNWTILRSNFYSQYLGLFRKQVAEGTLPLPIGRGRFSPIDVADVSSFARHVLENPDQYKFSTLDLTGPECLNGSQMASTLEKVLGHPVEFKDVSSDECKRILSENGVPENESQGFIQFFEITKGDSFCDPVTSYTHRSAMKSEPRSFEDTVRSNKEMWLNPESSCCHRWLVDP